MALISHKAPLRRRLEQWGCRRKANGPASSDLISRIDDLYHRTLWRDTKIAEELSEEFGLKVTRNKFRKSGLNKTGYAVHPIPMGALNNNLRPKNWSMTSFTPVLAVHTVAVGHKLIYDVAPGTVHA